MQAACDCIGSVSWTYTLIASRSAVELACLLVSYRPKLAASKTLASAVARGIAAKQRDQKLDSYVAYVLSIKVQVASICQSLPRHRIEPSEFGGHVQQCTEAALRLH